ncbi:hypothetical protein RIR_jg38959.t1 [Rhizophagus irregularis DAOM 181602=DAOM 197198]|nr:hypothetical protein RIR_jg38959.t1 [Rhizophagus irregularis DAOM 181602=DAOM 197198]
MLLKDVGDNCDDDDDDGGCGGDDRDDDDDVLNNSLIQAYISLLPDLRFDLKKYRSTSIDLRFHAQFLSSLEITCSPLSQQLFGNPGANVMMVFPLLNEKKITFFLSKKDVIYYWDSTILEIVQLYCRQN